MWWQDRVYGAEIHREAQKDVVRYSCHLPVYSLTFTEFVIWLFHMCILIIVVSYLVKCLSPTYNTSIEFLRPMEFCQDR